MVQFQQKWKNRVVDCRSTYGSWSNMVRRCTNPEYKDYSYYGGIGITVCDRWKYDFDAFVEDMGFCPEGLTLERINNTGNYEPSNCRWATRVDQARNRRSSRLLEVAGIIKHQTDWARELGFTDSTIHARLRKGIPIDTPRMKNKFSEHGDRNRYAKGCRCGICYAAEKRYRDSLKQRHALQFDL